MMQTPIEDPVLLLKPSAKLIAFLKNVKEPEAPSNVAALIRGKSTSDSRPKRFPESVPKRFMQEEDWKLIDSLALPAPEGSAGNFPETEGGNLTGDVCLTVGDLRWLNERIAEKREKGERCYLHEVLEGCGVVLPRNGVAERDPDLEKRCEKLRAQQANRDYKKMTKNIDNVRQQLPEDTISYQMKQMNRQLIAIGQFIVSVLAGFAFGFIGIELIIGNLDFGFRLLLGIICSLVIALAELYFLAKKLNEDLNLETKTEEDLKQNKLHVD